MFENFGKDGCEIFKWAENEMLELRHPYVGSEHLLLSLLKNDEYTKEVLGHYDIDYDSFRKELINIVGKASKKSEYILYTPLLRGIIDRAINLATESNEGLVNGEYLFKSLIYEDDGIAIRILKKMGVDFELIKDKMMVNGELNVLKEFGVLLGEDNDCLVGRDREIEEVINILLKKNKANPLLVGKAGVGKSAIAMEVARRIKNGNVPSKLMGFQVYSLNLGTLVSGTKYRGDFESRLGEIIKEVENNKIILFIDEIHGLVTAGSAEGAVSAAEILKPYLASGTVRVIGATTEREYERYIMKDKAIARRFDLVRLREPDSKETLEILRGIKREYESYHKVGISEEILTEIIRLSDQYMKDKAKPDRAIELLDLACASLQGQNEEKNLKKAKEEAIVNNNYELASKLTKDLEKLNGERSLTLGDLYRVLDNKLGIKIIDNDEILKQVVNRLDNIIGQGEVKEKLLRMVNYKLKQGGIISALLVGSTGTGKTESVKLIAEGLGVNFLRLDMSEYNLETAVNKLIGVSSGYVGYNDGCEFEKIKLKPNSVILVDEVEKAHPKVLNLFLQILDEGFITDALGDVIDFSNTLIFFTSNLGMKKMVGFSENFNNDLEEFFTPELLGRFDEILRYKKIRREDVIKYIDKWGSKDIDKEEVIKRSDYETYGLRNVKRVIKALEREKLAYN